MMTVIEETALMRLRVELYGAAQLLKGDALAEFKKLVAEIAITLDLDRGPHSLAAIATGAATTSDAPAPGEG